MLRLLAFIAIFVLCASSAALAACPASPNYGVEPATCKPVTPGTYIICGGAFPNPAGFYPNAAGSYPDPKGCYPNSVGRYPDTCDRPRYPFPPAGAYPSGPCPPSATPSFTATPTLTAPTPTPTPFSVVEVTVDQIQAAYKDGSLTAVRLVQMLKARIDKMNLQGPVLNGMVEVNPDAETIAAALDAEYQMRGPRGPMHGIPIVMKENIATNDKMLTTAGFCGLMLPECQPKFDAGVVEYLRKAGAIIFGKATMNEWASGGRGGGPIPGNPRASCPNGWSCRGSMLNRDNFTSPRPFGWVPKNPFNFVEVTGGSSTGSAISVAASFALAGLGTETSVSVTSPASNAGLCGIKPTSGLTSRAGVIPRSFTQDSIGVMARTCTDAVYAFEAMVGFDYLDWNSRPLLYNPPPLPYRQFLIKNGLAGVRLGVPRKFVNTFPAGIPLFEAALTVLRSLGAIIVDNTELPSFANIPVSYSGDVTLYDNVSDLRDYFARLPAACPIKDIPDIFNYNLANPEIEGLLTVCNQSAIDTMLRRPRGRDEPAYAPLLQSNFKLAAIDGINAVMAQYNLDALITPQPANLNQISAYIGYPIVVVPMGYTATNRPVGLNFQGLPYSEPDLIRFGYTYEQASLARKYPEPLLPFE